MIKIHYYLCLIVLICFTGHLSNALVCYECHPPAKCSNTTQVTCNQANANRTRSELEKYFLEVPQTVSEDFICLRTKTSYGDGLNAELAGCIYYETHPCKLSAKMQSNSWATYTCKYCSTNLCNSSASISSSFLQIILSILLLSYICLKTFK